MLIVMDFRERLQQGIVLFDGAMGTQIHDLMPTDQDYCGKIGCNEILNLSCPAQIQSIHENYFASGADVVETNSFGANQIVLHEYELADQCEAINFAAAQIAQKARARFQDNKPRFIAGSMGPGTKLVSLGQTDYDLMVRSYRTQCLGLIRGGVDLLLMETCQDPLQIKAAFQAACESQEILHRNVPVGVSITVETTGALLIGTELAAVIAILSPFPLAFLGINCATGPDHMRLYIKQMCQQFPGPILVMPNAGLPENVGGKIVYPCSIANFVQQVAEFIEQDGVQMVGGCCGTTPEFIQALYDRIQTCKMAPRTIHSIPSIASLFNVQPMFQEPRPLFIGERANAKGCKQFQEHLLRNNWDGVAAVAAEQQHSGAHAIDLCVAYTGRNELADMQQAISRIVRQNVLPVVIDSTEVNVLEAALKLYGGRPIINSINLEMGEQRVNEICALAKQFGTALIALVIDEQGMAMDVERKLAIARRIYQIAVQQNGLRPSDLIFDMLTFTLGSGDANLRNAAIHTLEAIRRIKQELPGVYTVLGVSNISFGLSPAAREVINSVFLAEAVRAGLDMAIVNVKKIMPLYAIPSEDRIIAENLIYSRGPGDPLFALIDHFRKKEGMTSQQSSPQRVVSLDDKIQQHIIQGIRTGLENVLQQKIANCKAIDIISQILIPAMKKVGDLFAKGEMQLPFVLQSAEVMKYAVDFIKPYLDQSQQQTPTKIVLATVRGDVHDIGKNLVDIILTNNGYLVYNLGIKCEIDTILKKAAEVQADAIGMSGLLVKSTVVMKENLEEMQRRGVKIPVLLGGAALTRSYVLDVCAPLVDAPVVYCGDAFDGLKAMKHIQSQTIHEYVGALKARHQTSVRTAHMMERPPLPMPEVITRDVNIPKPPFWGSRIVTEIKLDTVFNYITQEVLFRGRWGYRRNNLSKEAYQQLIDMQVKPEFERLKAWCKNDNIFSPKVIYGYYPCQSQGQDVIIYHPDNPQQSLMRLHFPRQKKHPGRCIADFFMPIESGVMDIIALQVVTIGSKAAEMAQELFTHDRYKEYLLFHGLGVETAEALAEYWHKVIRQELNITEQDGNGIEDFIVQKYRGSRYSFGYPACPDMEGNVRLSNILQLSKIGVTITESGQMVPEQTTSAFIVHHPQAKYFFVE